MDQLKPKPAINPSAPAVATAAEKRRVPMSVPQLKLSVPEIPGYHTHWMLGTPQRINQALRAGYSFVDHDEVDIVQTGIGNDAAMQGGSSLGSRVTMPAATYDLGPDGRSQDLVLMKLPKELHDADLLAIEDRNEQVARTIRGEPLTNENTYVPEYARKAMDNLFTPKRSK